MMTISEICKDSEKPIQSISKANASSDDATVPLESQYFFFQWGAGGIPLQREVENKAKSGFEGYKVFVLSSKQDRSRHPGTVIVFLEVNLWQQSFRAGVHLQQRKLKLANLCASMQASC